MCSSGLKGATHLFDVLDGNTHDSGEEEMSLADDWPDVAEYSPNSLGFYSKEHHV
jgi:hypothetical protein